MFELFKVVFFLCQNNIKLKIEVFSLVDYGGGDLDVSSLTCHLCWKVFKEHSCLKVHMRDIHEKPNVKQVCNFCNKEFKSINTLRNHKSLYHKGESKITY